MARSNEMVDKIDNRELAPASQPADLSQAGVTPDSYYRDQAGDRAASAPDDSAPRAGGVQTAQDLPAPSGKPEPQSTSMAEQAVSTNIAHEADPQVSVGATLPDGQGGWTDHDIAVGAEMDTDTTAGLTQSSASGSSLNPELLREGDGVSPSAQDLDKVVDTDGLAGATSGLASITAPLTGTVSGALDGVQGSITQVSGTVTEAVADLGGIVDADISEVLGSVTEATSVVGDAVGDIGGIASGSVDSLEDSVATGGLLGGLFDPGADESALDDLLGSGPALAADILGDDGAISLLDGGGLDAGSLLGGDDLDDGLGGLL